MNRKQPFLATVLGFALGIVSIVTMAAGYKISDLPIATSPSTNTWLEIADLDAATNKSARVQMIWANTPTAVKNLTGTNFFIGFEVGKDAVITNSFFNYVIGDDAFEGSGTIANNLWDSYFIGSYTAAESAFTNAFYLTFIGDSVGKRAVFDHSSDIHLFGNLIAYNASITNSHDLYALGYQSLYQSAITNSSSIYSYGGLQSAVLNDSKDVVSIGQTAGNSISGSYTNVIFLGDGSTTGATGQDKVIVGPAMTVEGALAMKAGSMVATNGITAGASAFTGTVTAPALTVTNGITTGGITNTGVTVNTPSSIQTLGASSNITVNASTMRVAGSGGAVTLTSTPSIQTNSIADGTMITIRGTSDSNTVTLQDYRTLSGSCIAMEVATITLLNGSEARFQWSAANQRWQAVAPMSANSSQNHNFNAITAIKAIQQYQGTLTHAGTVTLDFDAATTVNKIALTGNVTFASSNLATNRTYRLLVQPASTNCTPTWPTDWRFLGGRPTTLTASRWGMLSLEAWGSTDTNVVAAYAEEQ